jgi:adenine-specific DNA-methyltransferase
MMMSDKPTLFDAEETSSTPLRTAPRQASQRASSHANDEPMLLEGINKDVLTQGIKYAGSKLRIIPHLLRLVRDLPVRTVLDAFSGTTRVSQAFAKTGYAVISNDRAEWSECFATAYLLNRRPASHYSELIEHLNALKPLDGWFTEHYGGIDIGGSAIQADGTKRVWQRHNTMMLDAIREEIDALALDAVTKAVALTSLILALDSVDSTMGHFVAYLKEWSPRSRNEMQLRVPRLWEHRDDLTHKVMREDVFDCLRSVGAEADLTYFDPPYGSNNEKMPPSRVRYQSYYHIWKTVILNDRPPVFGAAKRRSDTSDSIAGSVFEDFRRYPSGRFVAIEAIDQMIEEARSRYLALSYSSGGRATAVELDDVLNSNGKILAAAEIEYKRNVMSGMRWTNEWLRDNDGQQHLEYLFLLEKD